MVDYVVFAGWMNAHMPNWFFKVVVTYVTRWFPAVFFSSVVPVDAVVGPYW